MKLGILFSGGKDSTYAAYLAKQEGYELSCLITIESLNKESFMFHTPSIKCTEVQAKAMGIPLIKVITKGKKENELKELEKAIKTAVTKYYIEGIVTGALESVYQASRVQKICNKLGIECFNPLWQKDQEEILKDLIKNKFEVVLTGVFAYPFDKKWLGRVIDSRFILGIKKLNEKYKINIAGEGGEYESLVLNCPLFNSRLVVKNFIDSGEGNSWRREVEVE